MQVTFTGQIISSGRGLPGLAAAWASVANIFTRELPKLIAALARIVA